MAFRYRSVPAAQALVLAVIGDVDLATEDRFRQLLQDALIHDPDRVVLDLGSAFLDVRGVSVLLDSVQHGRRRQDWLVVAAPPPLLRRVLTLVDPEVDLPWYETVADTLAAPLRDEPR